MDVRDTMSQYGKSIQFMASRQKMHENGLKIWVKCNYSKSFLIGRISRLHVPIFFLSFFFLFMLILQKITYLLMLPYISFDNQLQCFLFFLRSTGVAFFWTVLIEDSAIICKHWLPILFSNFSFIHFDLHISPIESIDCMSANQSDNAFDRINMCVK